MVSLGSVTQSLNLVVSVYTKLATMWFGLAIICSAQDCTFRGSNMAQDIGLTKDWVKAWECVTCLYDTRQEC